MITSMIAHTSITRTLLRLLVVIAGHSMIGSHCRFLICGLPLLLNEIENQIDNNSSVI